MAIDKLNKIRGIHFRKADRKKNMEKCLPLLKTHLFHGAAVDWNQLSGSQPYVPVRPIEVSSVPVHVKHSKKKKIVKG